MKRVGDSWAFSASQPTVARLEHRVPLRRATGAFRAVAEGEDPLPRVQHRRREPLQQLPLPHQCSVRKGPLVLLGTCLRGHFGALLPSVLLMAPQRLLSFPFLLLAFSSLVMLLLLLFELLTRSFRAPDLLLPAPVLVLRCSFLAPDLLMPRYSLRDPALLLVSS